MEQSTIWWLLTGLAVGVELVTGTFYLLMIALGLAAAAVGAQLGLSTGLQLVLAATVGPTAVLIWWKYKSSQPSDVPANANRDVNLDIGETVHIDVWNTDGSATVKYRGANWTVASAVGSPLTPGPHQVVEVVGSKLIVRKL
jgi:membrane protein implicated in regulation of membrane protease activity